MISFLRGLFWKRLFAHCGPGVLFGNRIILRHPGRIIEVQYNDELGEVEVFQYRTVVEKVVNEAREISLEEAKRHDPEAELDDDEPTSAHISGTFCRAADVDG